MRSLLLAPLLVLTACGDHAETHDRAADIAAEAVAEARAAAATDLDATVSPDVPGALVDEVATTDGAVVLGVTDEVLYSRLSPDLQDEIADEMDAEIGDAEGFGADLARTITGAVAEGLSTAVSIPLSDVRDVRYEDGRVVIEMADGEAAPFANAQSNDRPLLESFDADAGRRLADAFDKATR